MKHSERRALSPALILTLVVVAFVLGCSRTGDFGDFLVREVANYGGHTMTNANISALEARWTIRRDANGFQATVTRTSFANIDNFMRQAFGQPKVSVQGFHIWAAVDIGVAIQLIERSKGTEINCVRGMRSPPAQMYQEMGKP